MKPAPVIILGCGPSGLLAAHAAYLRGVEPIILSRRIKSVIGGAQFLHDPIPGITALEPEGHISFLKIGHPEGYAKKVYGRPDAETSWQSFPGGPRACWSMDRMYENLWGLYANSIIEYMVTPDQVGDLLGQYKTIISTIPAGSLCSHSEHQFKGQSVWIGNSAWRGCPENSIVYNGHPGDHWYRTSRIFGHEATESTTPFPHAQTGVKPLSTDCDCLPEVHRVGRFGTWKKGVLVHHAFHQAQEVITSALL